MRALGWTMTNAALIATLSVTSLAGAAPAASQQQEGDGSLAGAFGGAILMGAAGALAGYAIVSEAGESTTWEEVDAAYAGIAGMALGIGLGAHLGNGQRGILWLDMAVAAVGVGATTLATSAADAGPVPWVTGNVLVAVVTAVVEVETGRHRSSPLRLKIVPSAAGVRFGVSIPH